MNVGNMTTAGAKLNDALQKLQVHWENTQTQWHDENARYIDEQYMSQINTEVKTALQAVRQISDVLFQAARDCDQ